MGNHLFPQSATKRAEQASPSAPDFLPIPVPPTAAGENLKKVSPIDEALAKKLGPERLLRLRAMEFALQLRPLSIEGLGETFDKIYDKLLNGTIKKLH